MMDRLIELRSAVADMQRLRRRHVVVLAATQLETGLLSPLYDTLSEIGHTSSLDVVLYCRGGMIDAARKVALLLHEFTGHLSIIVPHHCESAGTMLLLAAQEIIAGSVAGFSPVDPQLQCAHSPSGNVPPSISSEDVRLFGKMSEVWFGMRDNDAHAYGFAMLCESVFATTITAFYRSVIEAKRLGAELLEMGRCPEQRRARILETLLFGYHSHSYSLTREDLKGLGLPLVTDQAMEGLAWQVSREIRKLVGGGARKALEDDWFDVLIATGRGATWRRRLGGSVASVWEGGRFE